MANPTKLASQVVAHLDEGEEILAIVSGQYEGMKKEEHIRTGIMVATPKRVVFYAKKITGFDFESFPYDMISSFEQSKNLMGHILTFFAAGNTVMLKWVPAKEVPDFVKVVRERMASKSTSGGTSNSDPTARLKKLTELKNAGLIDDDEYEAQRSKIVSEI